MSTVASPGTGPAPDRTGPLTVVPTVDARPAGSDAGARRSRVPGGAKTGAMVAPPTDRPRRPLGRDGGTPRRSGPAPRMELVTGAIAAGGGCVARAEDGRVVFVRHSLPGERVVAEVTSETTSFLRADAVEVLEPSADRVHPPCPLAGPGTVRRVRLAARGPPGPAGPEGVPGGRAAPPGGRSRPDGDGGGGGRGARRAGVADPGAVRRRPDRAGSGSTATGPTTSSRWPTARWPPRPSTGWGSARSGGGAPTTSR